MTFAREDAVLLMVRIEMRPRGRERRRIAFADCMDMNGVLAGRQVLDVDLHQQTAGGLHQISTTDIISLLVLDLRVDDGTRLGSSRDNESAEQQACPREF